ncbi:MAG: hypothetical protein ABH854_01805 [Candidatus Diapherotrites archaeon]
MPQEKIFVGLDISRGVGYLEKSEKNSAKNPLIIAQIIAKNFKEIRKAKEEIMRQFPGKGKDVGKSEGNRKGIYEILSRHSFQYSFLHYDKTQSPSILPENGNFKKYVFRTEDSPKEYPFKPHVKQATMAMWSVVKCFEEEGFYVEWDFCNCGDLSKGKAAKQIIEEIKKRLSTSKCRVRVDGDRNEDPEVYLADILAGCIGWEKIEGENKTVAVKFGDYFPDSTIVISFETTECKRDKKIKLKSRATYDKAGLRQFMGETAEQAEGRGEKNEEMSSVLSGANISTIEPIKLARAEN